MYVQCTYQGKSHITCYVKFAVGGRDLHPCLLDFPIIFGWSLKFDPLHMKGQFILEGGTPILSPMKSTSYFPAD